MGLLLLIPGIILLSVNAHWFSGQHDVGLVLTWAGGVILALQLAFIALIASKV
jgi:hypothetical protein